MLGDKLRYYRMKQNLTLHDVATSTGIAKSYLSDLERNQSCNPSVGHLIKLADCLHVPVVCLIEEFYAMKSDDEWLAIMRLAIQKGITKEEAWKFVELYDVLKNVLHNEKPST
ncbi:helix-turn-helix transcriptional regulator [Bacillus sp. CGMCC 1.16541]|uniref:helix-turn-helix domain-containing protein n=1 Tax=Bacillus sp. CGMCC 1.16541 TaxID=2185143 RepID=UPI000D73A897|nr:helix-turn-helix transcriptional regulator [Bacillus sp. CGMCC 1.16541]